MNKVIELFRKWYQSTYSEEANFNDDKIIVLLSAFQAGYEAHRSHTQVVRSPIKERQTPESATRIARQIREGLKNDSLEKQGAEETIVQASDSVGKQIMRQIRRNLADGCH